MIRPILLPPPLYSRPVLGQSLIMTSRAEDFRADVNLRREVEDHRVLAADGDTIAGLRAQLQQSIFDPDPMQSVGKVADRLGVGEVGLAYPSLRLGTAYPPKLTFRLNGEPRLIIDRLGPDDDPRRRAAVQWRGAR